MMDYVKLDMCNRLLEDVLLYVHLNTSSLGEEMSQYFSVMLLEMMGPWLLPAGKYVWGKYETVLSAGMQEYYIGTR